MKPISHSDSVPSAANVRLNFADRVGNYLDIKSSRSDPGHIINTALAVSVGTMLECWKDDVIATDAYTEINQDLRSGYAVFRRGRCIVSANSRHVDWGSYVLFFGPTLRETQSVYDDAVKEFGLRPVRVDPKKPAFHVLIQKDRQLTHRRVTLRDAPCADEHLLAMIYGKEFPAWAANLARKLATRQSSFTVLQGPPGTGKTSFLRWLIAESESDTDFYFLPVNDIHLLTDASFTTFWIDQCFYSPKPKALIIEDAEFLLMSRGPENSRWVAHLLNLTDGLLGDALTLHLIATVNCPIDGIDPALRRAGRLTHQWNFNNLSRNAAAELARHHGRELSAEGQEISLAEIFASPAIPHHANARAIGFQPQSR